MNEVERSRYRWAQILPILVFVPALSLAGATRFDSSQNTNGADAGVRISIGSAEQAREVEADLERDPENLIERDALMAFYSNQRDGDNLTKHMVWMIDHHPDLPLVGMTTFIGPANHELIKAAWERALASHTTSADVLNNAGLFIEQDDPARALTLFREAMRLAVSDPDRRRQYLESMAVVYAAAVIADVHSGDPRFLVNGMTFTSDTASALKTELQTSNDPALLSQTGTSLVQFREDAAGLRLIQQAIDLDPSNPHWQAALQSAKAEPIRRQNMQNMTSGGHAQQPMRIGEAVAASNLLTKVEPVYPSLARAARVQGEVGFTIDIGPDGRVQNIRLVRGHPLLVNAAKEAVLQWVYRATLLNGTPVAVTTTVVVPFRLDQ